MIQIDEWFQKLLTHGRKNLSLIGLLSLDKKIFFQTCFYQKMKLFRMVQTNLTIKGQQ